VVRWCLLLLFACRPPDAPPPPPAPVEDAGELLTDVQHLVGESAALHAAGRTRDALGAWERAYGIYQRHIAASLRAKDATGTLALEYTFGQLRAEVAQERGRPKALAGRLDHELEQRRPALAPAAPAVPVVPTP
jgi:hypothetical protein